jgi:Tat protein secretion system quality control protein TatD with DNase activity
MLGEVGLDKSFRVPYPVSLQGGESTDIERIQQAEGAIALSGIEELAASRTQQQLQKKVLTPFRPSMEHQTKLLEMQMEVAIELGVNVSVHSVQCQGRSVGFSPPHASSQAHQTISIGPTLDFLRDFSRRHPSFYSINFDIHSCGGFSVTSYISAQKLYPNLYMSPSLAISARSPVTPDLIRAVRSDRLLVESDTHLIGDSMRRVWAATVWIGRCRGWNVAGVSSHGNKQDEEDPNVDVVDVLERNWKSFMKME